MDLKKGAVSKRWSRLKTSMDANQTPTASVYKFLWLCVKHSTREKVSAMADRCDSRMTDHTQAPDWNAIADQCGTTAGAASKRYSRMKQAFEANAAPPDSNPASPAPKTPSKKAKAAAEDGEATPTPKRKRATPKKKVVDEDESEDDEVIKSEQDIDGDYGMTTPKKARTTKTKVTLKPKSFGTSPGKKDVAVKNEVEDDVEEPFVDAAEWVNELVDGELTSNDERKYISVPFCDLVSARRG
jgi:hypothetical protein